MQTKHISDREISWLISSTIALELSNPLKLISRAHSKHSYGIFPLKWLSKIGMAFSLFQWIMVWESIIHVSPLIFKKWQACYF